ncbi:MAG: hypothetical protein AMK72_12930 [Planctomycetes bacterium SM23_25]|nr:MAG: hypothetical protein AMK72_12930 [Planctomycetes bacterium SM23_25]
MRRRDRVPGCIFIGSGRYWWRVRLPGETKKKARPLVPEGGSYATNDPGVAEQVGRQPVRSRDSQRQKIRSGWRSFGRLTDRSRTVNGCLRAMFSAARRRAQT